MRTLAKNLVCYSILLLPFLAQAQQCLVNTQGEPNCLTGVGDATITITNGTPPYTVTSAPAGMGTVTSSNVYTVTNLSWGTTYNLVLKDANGCTANTQQIFVANPYPPSSVQFAPLSHVTCFGGSNGSVTASFSGIPPFTYTWSTGSHAASVTNLVSGIYTVTIRDNKACLVTQTVFINQPATFSASITATVVPCFGGTVSSAITATGGTSPFTHTIGGTPVSTATMALSAGVQTIVTKDGKNCIYTTTINLPSAPQHTISHAGTLPSCIGYTNGSISTTVTGPSPGYTFTWYPNGAQTPQLNNVPAGTYTLSITDNSACVTSSVFVLPPPPPIVPQITEKKETCSAADGAFTLTGSGGSPPYTYSILPVNTTSSVQSGLSTGMYTIYTIDSKNCVDTLVHWLGNTSNVSLSAQVSNNTKCHLTCDGSVVTTISNAVPPVTYSASGQPTTSTSTLSGLCPGPYLIKAIDAIGCPAFDTVVLSTPPVFTYSAEAQSPVCYGQTAVLSATAAGGTGAHTYLWQPGSMPGRSITVNPTGQTVYSLQVTDAIGCSLAPLQVTVDLLPRIQINAGTSGTGICPGTTAQITPSVSGGNGVYSYTWQPGNLHTPSIFIENLNIPVYTLTVEDDCGTPSETKEIELSLLPSTVPQYSMANNKGCVPLCIDFTNTTPKSSQVVWNYGDKPFEQIGQHTNYCYQKNGLFSVRLQLTDSNGCRAVILDTHAVEVLPAPQAVFVTDPAIITLNDSYDVKLLNGSTNASAFAWYVDGELYRTHREPAISFADTGCYDLRLVAVNSNGCRDSSDRSICVFEGFNFYMPTAFSPNNDGLNDVLLPKGSGWLQEDYLFEIFNRWGIVLFRSKLQAEGWDGGVKDELEDPFQKLAQPNDIYHWHVRIMDNQRQIRHFRGSVAVIR